MISKDMEDFLLSLTHEERAAIVDAARLASAAGELQKVLDRLDFVIRCKLADHDDLSDDLYQTSNRIERLRVEILDRLGVEE